MAEEVISLSSDEEFEPPPKKIKSALRPNPEKPGTFELLKALSGLKGITAKPKSDTKTVTKIFQTQESNITIIIEGEDRSKENENNVINLVDEGPDEVVIPEPKENNISSDCLIVNGSESETEDEPPLNEVTSSSNNKTLPESPPPVKSETDPLDSSSTKEHNGIETNGVDVKVETVREEMISRPSTSKASEAHSLLDEYLETCAKSMKGSKYESRVFPKFQKLRKNFIKCEHIHGDPNLKKLLQEHIVNAKINAPEAVVSFQRIYSYLLDHISGDSVEVAEEDVIKIKKLEKMIKRLVKRLKRLEEAEVNFDDEEDSVYLQMDRHTQRLNQVYTRYCKLLKRKPHAGRLLYEKIQFVQSKYNEINRAITKSYKHNKFPNYHDVEKVIRGCVTEHNLGLSETEIKAESKSCFEKMGNLLQMRRKKELYEVHCSFIALNEDPAIKDPELKNKLQESLSEGEKKMKEIVEKYVKKQESNEEVNLSSEDSDASNYKSSGDSDNNE